MNSMDRWLLHCWAERRVDAAWGEGRRAECHAHRLSEKAAAEAAQMGAEEQGKGKIIFTDSIPLAVTPAAQPPKSVLRLVPEE